MLKRFKYAKRGLFWLIRKDKNIRLHLFLFLILIVVSFLLKISFLEWAIVLVCSALVICLEALNTIIEDICDLIHPGFHSKIEKIKDVSAGVVLVASIFSLVVAIIIFAPKFFILL